MLMSVAVHLGKRDALIEYKTGIYFPPFLIKWKIVLLLFSHLTTIGVFGGCLSMTQYDCIFSLLCWELLKNVFKSCV